MLREERLFFTLVNFVSLCVNQKITQQSFQAPHRVVDDHHYSTQTHRFCTEDIRSSQSHHKRQCVSKQRLFHFFHTFRKRTAVSTEDVDAVNFLTNSMKDELRYAVFQANLQKHKFFTAVAAIDSVSARVLCCDSLNYHLMQSGDDLFTAGITGEHAYCLVSGDMKYFQDPRTSPVFAKKVEMVKENSWLSEAGRDVRTHDFKHARGYSKTSLHEESAVSIQSLFTWPLNLCFPLRPH